MRRLALLLALVPGLAWAVPSFVAKGTVAQAVSLTAAPTVSASAVTNDIIIVLTNSSLNAAITCTANCGSPAYAEVATQYGATSLRFSVWYRRVQAGESGAVPTPTFSQSGTAAKFTANSYVFRCVDTSTAIDVVSGSGIVAEASATTFTGDAVTTTVAGSTVIFAVGSQDDNTWGTPGGSIDTIQYDVGATSTPDNSIAVGYMENGNGAAGAKSAPTMVQASLGADAGVSLTFALRASTAALCSFPGAGGMNGFFP